ncbi:MAG: molybdopterin-guanine dinucleotide biosynthesis protein B [Desulfobacterales bacterium]|jgi:molybdopterin-guanine dinucleotide biosynthesis protein B
MTDHTPPVISIVSKKGAGKTTLIEKLIPELRGRGYRLGTVKHDTHGFDIDHEGKDTWRHKQSGAEIVAISSPWKLSLIKDVALEMTLDQLVTQYFSELDLVLTEGYLRAGKPQIEVFRRVAHAAPLHAKGDTGSLLAVMADTDIDLGLPRFHLDDIPGLADFIEQRFLA